MFIDEPNVPRWKPSAASLAALISSFLAEAGDLIVGHEGKVALYKQVVALYDKVLRGDEKMGFDRMDLDEVLNSQRIMILFTRGMLALSDFEGDSASLDSLRNTVQSILTLDCIRKNDDKYRQSWAVRETLNKAIAFTRVE